MHDSGVCRMMEMWAWSSSHRKKPKVDKFDSLSMARSVRYKLTKVRAPRPGGKMKPEQRLTGKRGKDTLDRL